MISYEIYEKNFIKISNRDSWLVKDIPSYHPDDPRHTSYWKNIKKQCIEGVWNKDFDGYRYMPGNLFFYINFCKILHVDKKNKSRKMIKPFLRDLEWELSYMCFVARGFSGFENDQYFSCHESFIDSSIEHTKYCYDNEGKLKNYVDPLVYLKRIHNQPLGLPLYENNAKNTMVLGSRGGGKSYYFALGENLHELIFDGCKYYTEDSIKNPAEIHINIGSGATDKSSEMCSKIKASNDCFSTDKDLGVWGEVGDDDYTPSIFYKDMTGSLQPNNAKSPWRHEYQIKVGGRWVKQGTGSKLIHTAYKDNAEAGAGGRFTISTIEECGLTENIIGIHSSNIATTQESSLKFGRQHYLGTAGNMEKIKESKEMFTHPNIYDLVTYEDIWEHSGSIGFFMPAPITNNDFKDENGNTLWEKALEYYNKRRNKAKKAKNPKVYESELMNYPLIPSEMFVNKEGNLFPTEELRNREKELLSKNYYERIGTSIDIYYDSSTITGVDYKLIDKQPIYEFPTPKNSDIQGCIVMYESPIMENGKIVSDLYSAIGYDPYVSENLDEGESLGSIYIMKNSKYLSKGYGGNQIVASYTGKHINGTKGFNENVEKLLMMYGNPYRSLWFEADRGKHVKSYFEYKNKLHLLCLRPSKEMNTSVSTKRITNYGWVTGTRYNKIQLIDMTSDWLKEETTIDGITKLNLERIPDIALIRELISFDLDKGNYDRIMALVGCVLGLREQETNYLNDIISKNNPLSSLSNNKYFKKHKQRKYANI